jgi:hypothetical protein
MIAQEVLLQQRKLAPKDDLSEFAGEWVILRDGRVIAHDEDPQQLIHDGTLNDRDALIRVSTASRFIF